MSFFDQDAVRQPLGSPVEPPPVPPPPAPACSRDRCPTCGRLSLISHCDLIWPGGPAEYDHESDDLARRGVFGRRRCTDLMCFVCLTRVSADGRYVFAYPQDQRPERDRCCGRPESCEQLRKNGNQICCP